MTIAYFEDESTGENYPLRIDYAGNISQGLMPYHSVEFAYAPRTDIQTKYVAGRKQEITQKLVSITAKAGSQVVKKYNLSYQVEADTGRPQITDIQACDVADDCSAASQFQWRDGALPFDDAQQVLPANAAEGAPSYNSNANNFWMAGQYRDSRRYSAV